MEQHPVPQAITTYKFRLVGDMTLRQFLELAFGGIIAWIIFASNLNFLFKWTLGPLFAFLGFGLAFVPIEDRPLDQWILNFVKAIFLPTQYIYKAEAKTLDIFRPAPPLPPPSSQTLGPRADLKEYLTSLPATPATVFEQAEQKYLEYIRQLFGALGINQPSQLETDHPQPANPFKTNLKGVRVRKLYTPQMCLLPHATIFQAPTEPIQASMPAPRSFSKVGPAPRSFSKVGPAPNVATGKVGPAPNVATGKVGPAPNVATGKVGLIKPRPVAEKPVVTKKVVSKPFIKPQPQPQPATVAPTFSTDIVLPSPPDKPNLLAGITLDKAGKIIPNVILEIQDKQNQPVRALKSNKLGQFFIATPLSDGIYQIHAEHPDQKFAIIKLEAKGEVIPPLKIQAL